MAPRQFINSVALGFRNRHFLEQDLTSMKANAYQAACENAWEVQEQKMLAAYQQLLNKA